MSTVDLTGELSEGDLAFRQIHQVDVFHEKIKCCSVCHRLQYLPILFQYEMFTKGQKWQLLLENKY